MMARPILAFVLALTAIAWSAAASAQKQPNVSDIATCNKEAEAAAGSPSALPRPPAPDTPAIGPKRDAAASTDSTGQLITRPADPRLEGMAAARAGDAAFRAAYRACMEQLGY
jgi:hypothetical protein